MMGGLGGFEHTSGVDDIGVEIGNTEAQGYAEAIIVEIEGTFRQNLFQVAAQVVGFIGPRAQHEPEETVFMQATQYILWAQDTVFEKG